VTEPRQPIRFTTSFDGVRIAFAITGKGPPLVRAPTLLTHVEYDWQSTMSRHWVSELSSRHTYLRLDPRTVGASQRDVADLSFEAIVKDLEAVVDAAGFERFDLLGTSFGPAVAIAYAAGHPERVGRLFLYGGYCRGSLKRNQTPEQTERALLYIKLAELGWGTDDPAFRQVFASEWVPGATKEQWRSLTEEMRRSVSRENAARFWRMASQVDVCDLARQLTAPALVLHAKGDQRVPYEEGKLTAALIPGAEFVTLDSCNHILLADEPAWPQLVAELRRFLPGVPDVAGGEPAGFAALSDRERQVLELMARGLSNDEIAKRLYVSPKTVGNHITSLYSKLAVNSRAQAIVRARDAGYGTALP
jgi:pimeloyl-ACP methyl ester carboxylesterase/DNA-binding CsgD family transcriptional regulator